ncbi:MAG TPA: 16S rRNA (guanine(966)-N(2))-methyltransferase RsmD [Gemmatimonadales bacterium]|nr:16S rRNA (guanine(966)-N(2))-methyltransferase RsmD [Gemmatimonadales bacterium]
MTRIVSGIWGGRRLVVPKDPRVRPTAERVREAWLSILGPDLPGARVLDLFAGSGALGLEALSRGATSVTFVEIGAPSLAALRANIAALDAQAVATVVRLDAMRFVERMAPGTFDLVLADPPFAIDFAPRLVRAWQARPFAPLVAIEHDPRVELHAGATRRWGDIAVTFLRTT